MTGTCLSKGFSPFFFINIRGLPRNTFLLEKKREITNFLGEQMVKTLTKVTNPSTHTKSPYFTKQEKTYFKITIPWCPKNINWMPNLRGGENRCGFSVISIFYQSTPVWCVFLKFMRVLVKGLGRTKSQTEIGGGGVIFPRVNFPTILF